MGARFLHASLLALLSDAQSGLFLAPQLFPPSPEPHRSPAASSVSRLHRAPHPGPPQAPRTPPVSVPQGPSREHPAAEGLQDGEHEPRPELKSAATGKGPLPKSAKLLTCRPHWSEQMVAPPAKCSPPGCGKEHEARAGQQRSRAERTNPRACKEHLLPNSYPPLVQGTPPSRSHTPLMQGTPPPPCQPPLVHD